MTEQAIWKDGHWEVAPAVRGENVPLPYQLMNSPERDRIIAQRHRYLEDMHDHFADSLIQPPEGVEQIESEHGPH